MTPFDLKNELKDFAVTPAELERLGPPVAKAIDIAGEAPAGIIPKIVMGAEGPLTVSVFLIFSNLISEVSATGEFTFDFVARTRIFHVRWYFGAVTFTPSPPPSATPPDSTDPPTPPDPPKAISYETATLWMAHGENNSSELAFVGASSERWVNLVRKFFAPSCLLHSETTSSQKA